MVYGCASDVKAKRFFFPKLNNFDFLEKQKEARLHNRRRFQ